MATYTEEDPVVIIASDNGGIDQRTGIEIISIYGKNKKPSTDKLQGLDYVIFDIQDIKILYT